MKTLTDIGISFQSDGTLKLDSTKFDKAASTNFSAVATALGAYGDVMKTTTTNLLSTSGVITSRTDGLNASVKNLDKRIDALKKDGRKSVLLLVAGVSLVLALAAMAVLARLPERTDCSPRLGKQVSARCLTMCLLELPSPRGLSRAVPAALVLPVAQPQPQPQPLR